MGKNSGLRTSVEFAMMAALYGGIGPLALPNGKPRQVRKEATVVIAAGALVRLMLPP